MPGEIEENHEILDDDSQRFEPGTCRIEVYSVISR
jgi:hypothetical protein